MSESAYAVGYGRPPEHTRFKKGQSGNPSGKPGPKKQLKRQFDAAFSQALNGDRWELQDARPAGVIEAFVRKVTLDALDGRPSAQRLVLAMLNGEDQGAAEEGNRTSPDAIITAEERTRELLGDRYEEFKSRFDAALSAGSGDELLALAKEFESLDEAAAAPNMTRTPEEN